MLLTTVVACGGRFETGDHGSPPDATAGAGGEGGMGGGATREPSCIHSIGDQREESVTCEGGTCTVVLIEAHHWQCSDGRVWEEDRPRLYEYPDPGMGGAGGAP